MGASGIWTFKRRNVVPKSEHWGSRLAVVWFGRKEFDTLANRDDDDDEDDEEDEASSWLLAKFEMSTAAFPTVKALYQMARMEQLLGQHDLALFHFRQSMKDTALPEADRREANKAIEDLKTKVGTITLDVPAGSEVRVDGNLVDPNKGPVEVAPGSHTVKVSLGAETRSQTAKCEAGKVAVIKIRFDEPPPNPPPNTNGNNGNANNGGGNNGNVVEPPPITPTESWWTTPHIAGVALAGVAAVGVGLGVAFTAVREGHVSDQEEMAKNPLLCQDVNSAGCKSFDDAGDSASTAGTLRLVSFIGAGLAGAGAVLLLLPKGGASASTSAGSGGNTTGSTPSSPTKPSSRTTVRVIPHGKGLSLVGTF
jgi:hypothetical protein